MEEKFKLSVIIKTKNNEDKLCETLESLKDFDEIIVIDEHSTDDTIDIAKEYKCKVIFADKNNLALAQNQALQEALNEWIFVVNKNEIIPQNLITQIQRYVLNPKKNKNCVSFFTKTFYLGREIKAAREKNVLRLFKKDCAEFKNDYSLDLKLKSGKIHKIKPSRQAKNAYILKFSENNIANLTNEILEKNRFVFKNLEKFSFSVFRKPMNVFLYWYIFKKAYLDGRYGFIYAKMKYFESFFLEVMKFERGMKK